MSREPTLTVLPILETFLIIVVGGFDKDILALGIRGGFKADEISGNFVSSALNDGLGLILLSLFF